MKRSLPDACPRGRFYNPRVSELFLAFGLLLAVAVTGCAGSLDPGVGGGGSNGAMGGSSGNGCQVAIFAGQCANCHIAGGNGAAGLDLASPNPEMRLVGKMGGSTGSCSIMTLLVANSNPATGVFVDKITLSSPPCGSSMPLGTLPSPADQSCLTGWATMVANAPQAFSGEETP